MDVTDAIGATITRSSARTLYWVLTTDVALTATPYVTILRAGTAPTPTTVWSAATWAGADALVGGLHTRTLSRLVAGPQGPTTGAPLVVPNTGEYSTWVRVDTATERLELEGQLLAIR